MKTYKYIFILFFIAALTQGVSAQKSDSLFKNRPSKKWSVGIQAGSALLHGDADQLKLGYSGGLQLKYSLSHSFGLRAIGNIGRLQGGRKTHNDGFDDYTFENNFMEGSVQLVYTLGNISYLRPARKLQTYMYVGIGSMKNDAKGQLPSKNRNFAYDKANFIAPFGLGVKYNINKKFDLGVDFGMRYVRGDSVDVFSYHEFLNRVFDLYSLGQVSLTMKLGKTDKHYDWINPVVSIYEEMVIIKDKTDKLTNDADKDGVADYFDKEPNTDPAAKVWGDGTAVDLDGDGIPDYKDKDRFTPMGAIVDADGVELDDDGDGTPNSKDLHPNTDTSLYISNNQGIPVMSKKAGVYGSKLGFLPAIFFDTDVDKVRPIHYADLQGIAEALKQFPLVKLNVIGNADFRAGDTYNMKLAERRAKSVIRILVEQFGVDPKRLNAMSQGEKLPIVKGSDTHSLQANRRVQFFIVEQ